MLRRLVLALFLLVGLAACVGQPDRALPTQALIASTNTPTSPPPTPTETPLPAPSLPDSTAALVTTPVEIQLVLGRVLADLAARLEVGTDRIAVTAVEEVTWPDARLGCSGEAQGEPLMGYRIVLTVDDVSYEYHTDFKDRFVTCDSGAQPTGEPVLLVDPVVNALVDLAQRNLAERLDLPQRRVFLVEVKSYLWPDNLLGCAISGEAAVAEPVPGYQIVFRVGRENYYYHTDYRQAIFCPEEALRLPDLTGGVTATPTATPSAQ